MSLVQWAGCLKYSGQGVSSTGGRVSLVQGQCVSSTGGRVSLVQGAVRL